MISEFFIEEIKLFVSQYMNGLTAVPDKNKSSVEFVANALITIYSPVVIQVVRENISFSKLNALFDALDNEKFYCDEVLENVGMQTLGSDFKRYRNNLRWKIYSSELRLQLEERRTFHPSTIKRISPELYTAMGVALKTEYATRGYPWEKLTDKLPEDLKARYRLPGEK